METTVNENNSIDNETKNILLRHILLIGHLLDVMKYTSQEDERLNELGINLSGLGYIEEKMWSGIKLIVGMPMEEKLGTFVDDRWISCVIKYIDGEITKEEAIRFIVDWKNEVTKNC